MSDERNEAGSLIGADGEKRVDRIESVVVTGIIVTGCGDCVEDE